MMPNYNQVTLIGHLGKDPDMRHLPSGDAVASFSLAVSENWKVDGEKKERTSWFEIVCFGKTAEYAGQYLIKGQAVLVAGKLQEDRWETQEGQKRSKVKVKAMNIVHLGRKKEKKEDDEAPF